MDEHVREQVGIGIFWVGMLAVVFGMVFWWSVGVRMLWPYVGYECDGTGGARVVLRTDALVGLNYWQMGGVDAAFFCADARRVASVSAFK